MLTQQLLNGLTIGTLYALVALGLTMVYGVLRILHFAHGAVYAIGAYACLLLLDRHVPFGVAAATALVVAAAAGVLVERFFYRPLARAAPILPLVAGVGVYLFVEDGLRLLFGPYSHAFPVDLALPPLAVGPVFLTGPQLLILGSGVILFPALGLFINGTRLGLQMRAVAADREMAAASGIAVGRIVALNFAIGSALAGLAGILVALDFNAVYPTMGALPGLKAFAAVVVGGLGSLPGAIIASLLLGVSESFIEGFLDLPLGRDAAAFVLLILVLMLRPQGLLGRRTDRV